MNELNFFSKQHHIGCELVFVFRYIYIYLTNIISYQSLKHSNNKTIMRILFILHLTFEMKFNFRASNVYCLQYNIFCALKNNNILRLILQKII